MLPVLLDAVMTGRVGISATVEDVDSCDIDESLDLILGRVFKRLSASFWSNWAFGGAVAGLTNSAPESRFEFLFD